MAEDLSQMTFEERKAFFEREYERQGQQAYRQYLEKELQNERAARRRAEYENTFTGRIRKLFGLGKSQKKQTSPDNSEQRKNIMRNLVYTLRDNEDWESVYVKAPDGLIYPTSEISVSGKTQQEIKLLQQALKEICGINTQVAVAGSRQNQDIDTTEVFAHKNNVYGKQINEGDTVLRVADPISNHNLPILLFHFAQIGADQLHDWDIPLTKAEYNTMVEKQNEQAKQTQLAQQKNSDMAEISKMISKMDPQQLALLRQQLLEGQPTDIAKGNSASSVPPTRLKDPRGSEGR